MSKRTVGKITQLAPKVGPHRTGERFVAEPPTLCLKTAKGDQHVLGRIETLTPKPTRPRWLNGSVRLVVSPKQGAIFNGQPCVRWAWKLVRGKSVLALSPVWYASRKTACRSAARFADYLLAEPPVEVQR